MTLSPARGRIPVAAEPVAERKVCVDGTHRARQPEDTLRWIEPVFEAVGITRLADVTRLDEIGIPVYQAIRPNARSLSVSQGKGLTPELAMVSAAMEAIELWHAEHLPPAARTATPRELDRELGYRVDEVACQARNALNPFTRLHWVPATVIRTGAQSWVPQELLTMDSRVRDEWCLPSLLPSTNGLASGNSRTEAVLHGLYEVVERDARTRAGHRGDARPLALDTVTGSGRSLLDQFARADVEVRVEVLPGPVGVACFAATIRGGSLPLAFGGSGCHLDRDVALCRALTEAAQSRLTFIAGTRDDIALGQYTRVDRASAWRRAAGAARGPRPVAYREVPTVRHEDLAADLRVMVDRVRAATGRDPVFVEHTRPELGVPVGHVVCPGLRFDPEHC